MWSGSGKINKATSNYVSKTTSKPSKKKQILLWNDVLSLKKVHTTRKVRYEMFFSLYQIFEDAIYGYTIVLRAWSSRLIIIEKNRIGQKYC